MYIVSILHTNDIKVKNTFANNCEERIEKFDFDHDRALECKEFTELMSFLILEKGLSFDYRYRYNMMI